MSSNKAAALLAVAAALLPLSALAAPTLDTTTCPSTTTTTVAGGNASTTNITVSSSVGFATNTTVVVTALNSYHTVTAVPDATHITVSPATSSAVTSGSITGACPLERFSIGGVYTAGSATQNFPVPVKCTGTGTHLFAVTLDEDHGVATTTTGIPVISPGNSANYSTQWALVANSGLASIDGGVSVYHAVCTANDTPKVTVTCTGSGNPCVTGTAAGNMETVVQVWGFTPASIFVTPGNATTGHHSTGGTPSLTLTTSVGDKLLMGWSDFTGANCTQSLSTGASIFSVAAIPGPLNSGCNGGADDYYAFEWTTTTVPSTSTTIGVTSPTNAVGAWTAVEICDSSATSCPNAAGAAVIYNWMNMGVGN